MKLLKYILSFILLSFLLMVGGCRHSSSGEVAADRIQEETITPPDTIRLLFAGDVMVHSTQYHAAWREGGDSVYNFHPPFAFIKEYISSADLNMANLEVTLGGRPYSGYPLFSSPVEIVDALKESRFALLFTANNHAADKGRKGIEKTIAYLDALGLLHTGSFRDSTEKARLHPLIVEVKGIKLAFLNYTYSTNGMPVYPPALVNITDTLQMREDLIRTRQMNPDYIITCMHWGYEYHKKEHPEQQQLASFLAENGCDLIIGSHSHTVQPYAEIINQAGDTIPVIYSLGNYISNQQWRRSDGGIVFEVTLEKSDERVRRIATAYEPFWVKRAANDSLRTVYRMIPVNDFLRDSAKYSLDTHQTHLINLFYEDTREILHNLPFSGFFNRDSL